jgi:hypothetical protein
MTRGRAALALLTVCVAEVAAGANGWMLGRGGMLGLALMLGVLPLSGGLLLALVIQGHILEPVQPDDAPDMDAS